jgi:microcystin degradation protein MlrC
VVQHRGITILLTSIATAPFDLAQWRSQGITPEQLSIIGVKAAVAHRQAYNPIQCASYTLNTLGPCAPDLRVLPFTRVPAGVYPLS